MANGQAVQAGSGVGGAIEGFLSGVEAGGRIRDRRTARQFAVDDRLREQIAAQLMAGRQEVLDRQNAAEAARHAAGHELETGLTPTTGAATPGPTGAGTGVPERVEQLRGDVGRALDHGSVVREGELATIQASGAQAAPAGFRRVGPSEDERERERVTGLRTSVSRFLTASPEEQQEMLRDPSMIGALEELGQLDEVFDIQRGDDRPLSVSVGGITGQAETPEEAIALRAQLTLEETGIVDPKAASDLRQEFDKKVVVRNSSLIAQSFRKLQAVAEAEPSGANDLAIIFSFMKMVDPGSTVREGEFATAENAQGVPERVRAMYNRAIEGTRLAPETRVEFIESARNLVRGQQLALADVVARYTGLAERAGVPTIDVVFDSLKGLLGDGDNPEEDELILQLIREGFSDEEAESRVRAIRQGR